MNENQYQPNTNSQSGSLETHEHESVSSEKTAEAITKMLAIIGLIAILALAAWISVQVIRFTPSVFTGVSEGVNSALVSLSSVFGGDDEDDTKNSFSVATTHPVAESGDEVVIDWRHEHSEDTTYAIAVSCQEGVTFVVKVDDEEKKLECEKELQVGENTSVVLIADNTTEESPVMTVTVFAHEAGKPVVSKEIALTLDSTVVASGDDDDNTPEAPAKPQPPVRPIPQTTVTYETPISNPNGTADLSVRILATGIKLENTANSTFFAVSPIPSDKIAAVKFVVENIGDKTSEEFSFTATLPVEYDDDFVFESDEQQTLKPGEKIEYVLGFDQVKNADNGQITIKISPDGTDKSSLNNIAVSIVEIDEK